MCKFIKLNQTNGNGEMYFNISCIYAVNKDKGIVYCSNGAGTDIFFICDKDMNLLVRVLDNYILREGDFNA